MFFLEDILSLIYPRLCMACGNSLFKNEETICTHCCYHLPKTNFHLLKDNSVSKLFWGRVKIESAASYYFFQKESKTQKLIHQLKYQKQKEIGIYIGKQYGYELMKSEFFNTIEVIVPVPLHQKKFKKRGYNQSELFANGLSQSMRVEVNTDALFRAINTDSQTKKSKYNRWENVKDIFQIKNAEHLQNKHILLVDDVVTTGATIEACASKLLTIEGTKISIATIACAY